MAVERLVAVDVPVHAEHAAPAGLVVRAAVLVVIGATREESDVDGGVVGFFQFSFIFHSASNFHTHINLRCLSLRRGRQVNEVQISSSSSQSSYFNIKAIKIPNYVIKSAVFLEAKFSAMVKIQNFNDRRPRRRSVRWGFPLFPSFL